MGDFMQGIMVKYYFGIMLLVSVSWPTLAQSSGYPIHPDFIDIDEWATSAISEIGERAAFETIIGPVILDYLSYPIFYPEEIEGTFLKISEYLPEDSTWLRRISYDWDSLDLVTFIVNSAWFFSRTRIDLAAEWEAIGLIESYQSFIERIVAPTSHALFTLQIDTDLFEYVQTRPSQYGRAYTIPESSGTSTLPAGTDVILLRFVGIQGREGHGTPQFFVLHNRFFGGWVSLLDHYEFVQQAYENGRISEVAFAQQIEYGYTFGPFQKVHFGRFSWVRYHPLNQYQDVISLESWFYSNIIWDSIFVERRDDDMIHGTRIFDRIMNQSLYGVRELLFSPDGQYLFMLGIWRNTLIFRVYRSVEGSVEVFLSHEFDQDQSSIIGMHPVPYQKTRVSEFHDRFEIDFQGSSLDEPGSENYHPNLTFVIHKLDRTLTLIEQDSDHFSSRSGE
jgi:hypothetical protein